MGKTTVKSLFSKQRRKDRKASGLKRVRKAKVPAESSEYPPDTIQDTYTPKSSSKYTSINSRCNARQRFCETLVRHIPDDLHDKVEDAIPLSGLMENALFDYCSGSDRLLRYYATRYRQLISNMRDTPKFVYKLWNLYVAKDKSSLYTIIESATHKEMGQGNKELLAIQEDIAEANNGRGRLIDLSTNCVTDMFKCGRCKQNKTSFYQMQTRGGDEPMTTFIRCLNCNHKWKQ